ncbi:hypothetical protein FQN54_008915 [Arachnomyces sp. PD_36]|nr:hypothetical protein FQN54_008915 [Arachnomyces sp. PD_36]
MFSLKRQRDEYAGDGEPEILDGFEHERKKPRPLPFRTSPTSKHTRSFSQNHLHHFIPRADHTLTPTESSDEDEADDNDKHRKPKAQSFLPPVELPTLQLPNNNNSTDCDMEMADPEPQPTAALSPWSAGLTNNGGTLMPSPIPGHLINQSLNLSGGRTATPIYGHFTRNMDLNAMAQTSSPALAPPSWGKVSSPAPSTAESDWWRRRRLPSPISEGEDSPATPADYMTGQLREMYGKYQEDFGGLAPLPDDDDSMLDATRQAVPRIVTSSVDENGVAQNRAPPVELSAPPAPRFRHTEHSNNDQPLADTHGQSHNRSNGFGASGGGKISFSMGYRADCDKCQRKVPGHYSHIVRS